MSAHDWKALSPEGKVTACQSAFRDGANTADEIAVIVGTSKGAVIGLLNRQGVELLCGGLSPKAKAERPAGKIQAVAPKSTVDEKPTPTPKLVHSADTPPDPTKPLWRPHKKPAALPKPGEGVPMAEAVENKGCRYIIGDPCGDDTIMHGAPITEGSRFLFCDDCQAVLMPKAPRKVSEVPRR